MWKIIVRLQFEVNFILKPPGRITGMAQDDWVRTALRLPAELHAQVHAAADAAGRSFNAEIIERLVNAEHLERRLTELVKQMGHDVATAHQFKAERDQLRAEVERLDREVKAALALTAEQEALLRASDEQKADLRAQLAQLTKALDTARAALEPLKGERRAEIVEMMNAAINERKEVAATREIDSLRKRVADLSALADTKSREGELMAMMMRTMAGAAVRAIERLPQEARRGEMDLWDALARNILKGVSLPTLALFQRMAAPGDHHSISKDEIRTIENLFGGAKISLDAPEPKKAKKTR